MEIDKIRDAIDEALRFVERANNAVAAIKKYDENIIHGSRTKNWSEGTWPGATVAAMKRSSLDLSAALVALRKR